jgi:very-short-patch-repair endonuclease
MDITLISGGITIKSDAKSPQGADGGCNMSIVAARKVPDAVSESTVLTAAQWRDIGVTRAQLQSLAGSGELVQFRHGVYATRKAVSDAAGSPRRLHALRVRAIQAAVGFDVIASHHSAARIHGLDMVFPPAEDLVSVTRRSPGRIVRSRSTGVVVHNVPVPDWQLTGAFGISLTNVSRTVIDVARTSPFQAGVAIADCALRRNRTSKPELMAIVETCKQWPGIAKAARVVRFSDGNAESVLESVARVAFAAAGLEPPQLQATIPVFRDTFRVDFYWRQYQTIAEADGLGKLAQPEDLKKQFARDRKLRAAGYQVAHFTWDEIFGTPQYVVAQVREAFAASGSP